MSALENFYDACCKRIDDIHEHLPTLKKYASECNTIAEFGVRGGDSSSALLLGLKENANNVKKAYFGVDINPCPITATMNTFATDNQIEYTFIQCDSASVTIPDVDLLFIDSWHIYGHLIRELNNSCDKVAKYILMHDTTVDEWDGESIRCGWDINSQAKKSGYPKEEIAKGLWPAIEDFLAAHSEWKLKERFTNNNGLTILERVNEA